MDSQSSKMSDRKLIHTETMTVACFVREGNSQDEYGSQQC